MAESGRAMGGSAAAPVSFETKRRVRLAEGQRRGFESAWNEYYDCYATTTYLEKPLIKLEDIGYHLYLKKNISRTDPTWELPSFRQQMRTLDLSQDKIQGIEARLQRAGLLVKESGRGRGPRGENVANDYLLYEPKELGDFLAAVERGELPGALNAKGTQKLATLRARYAEAAPVAEAVPADAAPALTPVAQNTTPPVRRSVTAAVRPGATHNRRSPTHGIQQTEQQQAGAATEAGDTGGVVVVAVDHFIEQLVERGITSAVARRLVRAVPAATVVRQLAVFDFLRRGADDERRVGPGRLRRMIEEDWTPPAEFMAGGGDGPHPPAPAPTGGGRGGAASGSGVSRPPARRGDAAGDAARRARQAALAAIGATAADQVLWERLALDAPRLPALFRGAIFHAPRGDEPAALVFPDRAACARAQSEVYAAERQRIARRVGGEYGRAGVRVRYLAYEDVARPAPGGAPA